MKAIVLAAGDCSNFWPLASDRHKTMYEVGAGRPVLWHTLHGLKKSGFKEIILVTRPGDQGNSIIKYFGLGTSLDLDLEYIEQPESLGLGDALIQAKQLLAPGYKRVLVLNGEQVDIERILSDGQDLSKSPADQFLLFAQRVDSWEHLSLMVDGQIKLSMGYVQDSPDFVGYLQEAGIYCLPEWFMEVVADKSYQRKYVWEVAFNLAISQPPGVRANLIASSWLKLSLEYPWDLLTLNSFLMAEDFEKGVVKKSDDIKIHPSALISGPVIIEKGVEIMEQAIVKGPVYLGEGAVIGTQSFVYGGCLIGPRVVVGENSTVKNSLIYEGVELHRNYVGDSILDQGASLGARVTTANSLFKDESLIRPNVKSVIGGRRLDTNRGKLGVIMGAKAQIGIGTNILPGIKIGSLAKIWPGVTVYHDVLDAENVKSSN